MARQLIRLVSGVLIFIGMLTHGDDSEVEHSEDRWTHAPHLTKMAEQWREAGYSDLPVSLLPPGVAEQLEIDSEYITPEVLFSNEMQAALTERLGTSTAPRLFSVNLAEINESVQLPELLHPDVDIDELKRMFAENEGLESVDELTPQMIEQVTELHARSEQIREQIQTQLRQFDAKKYQQQFEGGPDSNVIELETVVEPNHTEEDFSRAWNALSAEDKQVLEPLRHLRDNKTLFLERLSDAQRDAGSRYRRNLGAIRPHPLTAYFKQQLMPLAEAKHQSTQALGYTDRTSRVAPTTSTRKSIESTLQDSRSSFGDEVEGKAIYRLDSPEADELRSAVSPIPDEYISPSSENYLIKRRGELHRFYSDTIFGGSLLLKQQAVVGGSVFFPNATIAGREAKIVSALHSDETWNTAITAFSDVHIHRIYAEGRLEGEKLKSLIELAEHVANSANIGL